MSGPGTAIGVSAFPCSLKSAWRGSTLGSAPAARAGRRAGQRLGACAGPAPDHDGHELDPRADEGAANLSSSPHAYKPAAADRELQRLRELKTPRTLHISLQAGRRAGISS